MTQNEHVYATCSRPEVDYDVITGRNVKTIENVNTNDGYALLNFEAASLSSFRENKSRPFA